MQQHSYLVLMESVLKAVEVPRRGAFIASVATPVSSGPVPKIPLNLGISKQTSKPWLATFHSYQTHTKGLSTQSTLASRVYERRERSIFLLPSLFCHQNKASNCSIHTEYEFRIRAPHRQSWEVESKLSKFTCTCSTDDNSCSDF